MGSIQRIWLIHTTSTAADADADAGQYTLLVRVNTGPNGVARFAFPDIRGDQRERGKTEQYEFDLTSLPAVLQMEDIEPGDLSIEMDSDDAWLPSSVWVIGEDESGVRSLLAGVPEWPTTVEDGWFSIAPSEGKPSRSLQGP